MSSQDSYVLSDTCSSSGTDTFSDNSLDTYSSSSLDTYSSSSLDTYSSSSLDTYSSNGKQDFIYPFTKFLTIGDILDCTKVVYSEYNTYNGLFFNLSAFTHNENLHGLFECNGVFDIKCLDIVDEDLSTFYTVNGNGFVEELNKYIYELPSSLFVAINGNFVKGLVNKN
jgi:hypothetical protein